MADIHSHEMQRITYITLSFNSLQNNLLNYNCLVISNISEIVVNDLFQNTYQV